jgi:hypothetical protein
MQEKTVMANRYLTGNKKQKKQTGKKKYPKEVISMGT